MKSASLRNLVLLIRAKVWDLFVCVAVAARHTQRHYSVTSISTNLLTIT